MGCFGWGTKAYVEKKYVHFLSRIVAVNLCNLRAPMHQADQLLETAATHKFSGYK